MLFEPDLHMDGSGASPIRTLRGTLRAIAAALAIGVSPGPVSAADQSGGSEQSAGQQASSTRDVIAQMGAEFASETAAVDGLALHYVRGGSGPAVVLLHGWPEDWSEWRKVMPRLADDFAVVAVDLRGVGGSKATQDGYDQATMARDIHGLVQQLDLDNPYIVGHDIGGMVAYAYARLFPDQTRGVMIVDVPLPGIKPWQEVVADPLMWHFQFHQTPDLPEMLVAGHQENYIRDFIDRIAANKDAISNEAVAHFAQSYGSTESLRAGFEFYRAFQENAEFNKSRDEDLNMPIALVGGEHAVGQLNPTIAEAVKQRGVDDVSVETIEGSGHFVPEEKPEELALLIAEYAGTP